jgi:exodeoxyribonuclease V alpha subunit
MNPAVTLSPLGTARPTVEDPLVAWLEPVLARLQSEFAIDREIGFLAWELARWPEGLALDERAALTILILTALVGLRQGSTRVSLSAEAGDALRPDVARRLLNPAFPTLNLDAGRALAIADGLIESGRASAIVGVAGEFKPLIVAGPNLYLQKMHALEQRFAASFGARLARGSTGWDGEKAEQALVDVQSRPALADGEPVALSGEQAVALRAALHYPLVVISGGPGTGKTTIVVSILRALGRLGIKPGAIAMAGPTAKSAYRLGQAVRSGLAEIADATSVDRALLDLSEPQTLHRLLGANPTTGQFLYHENNPLAADVVVVDEASMIDLVLMERLLRSLPREARLILLGDDHQLPSVEAGAVLRDLIAGHAPLGPRAVRLTESYRMRTDDPDGRDILTVSGAIDSGKTPEINPDRTGDGVVCQRASAAAVTFHGVEFVETAEGTSVLSDFLDRWDEEVVCALADFNLLVGHEYSLGQDGFDESDVRRLGRLFDHFEHARVLCLTRIRPTGADRVNAELHRRALRRAARAPERGAELIAGEPVMIQVNDYDRMLFNGDQGLVLRVRVGARVASMAVFTRDEGFAAFSIDTLRSNLLHSYALTVHKAQGSEYDRIALILPDADIPINTREILYTALTRSRTAVTILGTRDVFARGIARRIERSSGLVEMLKDGPP